MGVGVDSDVIVGGGASRLAAELRGVVTDAAATSPAGAATASERVVANLAVLSAHSTEAVSLAFRRSLASTIAKPPSAGRFAAIQALVDLALDCSERHKDGVLHLDHVLGKDFVDVALPLLLIEDALDMLTIENAP
ncbi:hypothetical protein HK405_005646, partial [Cladochytrium tenue]